MDNDGAVFIDDINEDIYKDNIVCVTDEDGNEIRLEFLDLIPYDSKEYVIFLPCDENEGEVLILELIENEDGEESFGSVNDKEVLDAVFEIFNNRIEKRNKRRKIEEKFNDLFNS